MVMTIDDNVVLKSLGDAFELEIKKALEREIEIAKQRLEEELRKKVAEIALSLHKYYSIEHRMEEIIIRVRNIT